MSTPSRHKYWQICSVAFVCASAVICGTDSGVALAWYGPPALPASATPPGGFSDIITSQTIDPSGGTIGPLNDGGLPVTITIPPDTFPTAVQVTVSEPFGSSQSQGYPLSGMAGFRLVGGVGIEVSEGNTAIARFPHPLRLRIGRLSVAGFKSEAAGVVDATGHVSAVAGRRHDGPITLAVRKSEVLAGFVSTRFRSDFRGNTASDSTAAGRIASARYLVVSRAEILTAALQPAGSWLPGLGVIQVADGGSLLGAARTDGQVSR
jgi:hypothetical protein